MASFVCSESSTLPDDHDGSMHSNSPDKQFESADNTNGRDDVIEWYIFVVALSLLIFIKKSILIV